MGDLKNLDISIEDLYNENHLVADYTKIKGDIVEIDGENVVGINLGWRSLIILPESIGSLVNLEALNQYNNYLTSHPESIGDLINHTRMNLNDNKLISLPDRVGNMVNLNRLELSDNKLTNLPDSISNLVNLSHELSGFDN